MKQQIALLILRHAATIAAGVLVTKGVIDKDTADQTIDMAEVAAGGVIGFIGIVASILQKIKAAKAAKQ